MLLVALISTAQEQRGGLNNPYVDDKVVHFGFSLGMNLMHFGVTDSELPVMVGDNEEILHARVSNLMPGFSVGFITDVRLCRYLNLRFTPTLHFGSRTISYKTESGRPVAGSMGHGSTTDVLSMPIDIPLYLKFSAERERNYRPYLIAGGGFSYNVTRDHERPVMLKGPDWFVAVGAGCDLYLRWFKLCPEIKYQIGFNDVLVPYDQRTEVSVTDAFYTQAIRRLTSRMLTVTINFE